VQRAHAHTCMACGRITPVQHTHADATQSICTQPACSSASMCFPQGNCQQGRSHIMRRAHNQLTRQPSQALRSPTTHPVLNSALINRGTMHQPFYDRSTLGTRTVPLSAPQLNSALVSRAIAILKTVSCHAIAMTSSRCCSHQPTWYRSYIVSQACLDHRLLPLVQAHRMPYVSSSSGTT
jgi:hypothetical protein